MESANDLEATQLDALSEVANIGAGHAATALSQLVKGRRVMIDVPTVKLVSQENFADVFDDPDQLHFAVSLQTLGDITGRAMLVLAEANGRLLCDHLLQREPGTTDALGELEESSLKEAGNILASAYVNALASFMDMMILPSVPTLVVDRAAALSDRLAIGGDETQNLMFCAATEFAFDDVGAVGTMSGYLLHLPDLASLKAILEAIRLA